MTIIKVINRKDNNHLMIKYLYDSDNSSVCLTNFVTTIRKDGYGWNEISEECVEDIILAHKI